MSLKEKIGRITGFNQANRDAWVAGAAARLPKGARVLDVGAGECRYRHLFEHCDYKTQDFCGYEGTKEGPLAQEWHYGRIDYVCEINHIPAPDQSFDAILCTEVLEHVPEPIEAIKQFHRLLKPGGRLFLSAPLGAGLHQQPYHYYGGFTPHFYQTFLTRYGFEIVRVEPNGGFFRHLLQETARASSIIATERRYSKWNPLYWLAHIVLGVFLPVWFARLDDRIFIEEFTVGYHVEARKA